MLEALVGALVNVRPPPYSAMRPNYPVAFTRMPTLTTPHGDLGENKSCFHRIIRFTSSKRRQLVLPGAENVPWRQHTSTLNFALWPGSLYRARTPILFIVTQSMNCPYFPLLESQFRNPRLILKTVDDPTHFPLENSSDAPADVRRTFPRPGM